MISFLAAIVTSFAAISTSFSFISIMFPSQCAACNVSVQPNKAEWSKHVNGKQHRKRTIGPELPRLSVKVATVNGVTEDGLLNLAYSTHSPQNGGHHITATTSLISSSSISLVSSKSCDHLSPASPISIDDRCLPACNDVTPPVSRSCQIAPPKIVKASFTTVNNTSRIKTTDNSMVYNEVSIFESPSYSHICQQFDTVFVNHFNPSEYAIDDRRDSVFEYHTLQKLRKGLTDNVFFELVNSLPKSTLFLQKCKSGFSSSSSSCSTYQPCSSSQKTPNFVMFCECCNVTCFSQADWKTHTQLIKHQQKELETETEEECDERDHSARVINKRLQRMMELNGVVTSKVVLCEEDDDYYSDVYDDDDDDAYYDVDGYEIYDIASAFDLDSTEDDVYGAVD